MSEERETRPGTKPGFRLDRVEVLNWGTFSRRVWGLNCRGDNVLLTGDIGSGKSTLVDAITTLLVAPQRITYNKAAGAETRERTLRTYVLGHYRSERGDTGVSTKPVALRDYASYSTILARFVNDELAQTVTLAQVFWWKDTQGQPARFYVVADAALSITEHFANFGVEIERLRKRLRGAAGVEVFDAFPAYGTAFRRRLGIDGEQAMDLFYQTVSMKSVGNLTEFVREHMLEAFPVEDRITALLGHFDDLSRAHEAVLKTKMQISLLIPLVANGAKHDALSASISENRACREALKPWFATLKHGLLEKRIAALEHQLATLAERIAGLAPRLTEQRRNHEAIRQAISENGGDRLEQIRQAIDDKQRTRDRRVERASSYNALAQAAELPGASDVDTFLRNRDALTIRRDAEEASQASLQNALTEATVDVRQLKERHDDLTAELTSLRGRRSSIPEHRLVVRGKLCQALGIAENSVPFAGELIQVRDDARDWEGAIERILHTFATSILVADRQYSRVAEWVDRTNLRGHVRYNRVRDQRIASGPAPDARSLVHKLTVQSTSPFYAWVDAELARRFDYTCCATLDEFRRAERAVTRAGQTKAKGDRHEKDDRRSIDDRTTFVLGWSNEGKIRALEKQAEDIAARGLVAWNRKADADEQLKAVQKRWATLQQLAMFDSFLDLDWKAAALEIAQLERERHQLEAASDVLRTLEEQLRAAADSVNATEEEMGQLNRTHAVLEERLKVARAQRADCAVLIAQATEDDRTARFQQLEAMVARALGEGTLTVESCDSQQQVYRKWLQDQIDADNTKASRTAEEIVSAMRAYSDAYPQDTREVDASVASAGEYRGMLEHLESDDLPRFEGRFKALLNENTIREIANFQSQLLKERQTIAERVARINQSLRSIDYNPARYIELQAEPSGDTEIRDFQQQLRACTDDTLTGSRDDTYSEAKFLQVKQIIERFRGREGATELDRRWTSKVTDVRRWYVFSASERWREDNKEYEHYADSGGKSGGQKEKLAYTVLAASLAYQFGLDSGVRRPRSFHFVLIDEAFGRGSDESARYGLELFGRLNLQLLVVTPMQKIHVIEPFVASVGFVHNPDGRDSVLRNLTIEE